MSPASPPRAETMVRYGRLIPLLTRRWLSSTVRAPAVGAGSRVVGGEEAKVLPKAASRDERRRLPPGLCKPSDEFTRIPRIYSLSWQAQKARRLTSLWARELLDFPTVAAIT